MGVREGSALLVAAGEISVDIFRNLLSDKKIIVAIDGGYNHCLTHNVNPDIIIGDFDSINSSSFPEKTHLIFTESQNETDLSKAIKWCISSDINNLDIIGVESGRSDHILGTFAAFAEINQDFSKHLDIKLHLNDFIVKYVPKKKKTKLILDKETHLSLFCLSKSIVNFQGVKWPLNNEEMNFSTRGIHNYSINNEIELFVSKGGPVLLFIMRN